MICDRCGVERDLEHYCLDALKAERDRLLLQVREARELIEFMRQHLDGDFLCDGNDACTCIEHSAVRFLKGCAVKPKDETEEIRALREAAERANARVTEEQLCVICKDRPMIHSERCPECYAVLVAGAERRVDPVPKLAPGFCRCYCHAGGSGASSACGCCSY